MTRIGWREMMFLAICVVQLAVPARWLVQHQAALDGGEVFRFRCAPVDPVDVMRGHYVRLAFEQRRVSLPAGARIERGDNLFVRLDTASDGFAGLGAATTTAPEDGAYLKVQVRSVDGGEAEVVLPFERYYMEEKKAPQAEGAYRRQVGSEQDDTFVQVRVLDGEAVLEELYVGGVRATDLPE